MFSFWEYLCLILCLLLMEILSIIYLFVMAFLIIKEFFRFGLELSFLGKQICHLLISPRYSPPTTYQLLFRILLILTKFKGLYTIQWRHIRLILGPQLILDNLEIGQVQNQQLSHDIRNLTTSYWALNLYELIIQNAYILKLLQAGRQ